MLLSAVARFETSRGSAELDVDVEVNDVAVAVARDLDVEAMAEVAILSNRLLSRKLDPEQRKKERHDVVSLASIHQ